MPPVLAARVPQTPTEWVIIGGSVVVALGFMIVRGLYHRRRRARLGAAAQEMGLAMVDVKSGDAGFVHEQAKGQSRPVLRLCCVGVVDGLAMRLAEFTFDTGSGKSRRTHYSLQLSVECPGEWPALRVEERPGLLRRPISELVGRSKQAADDDPFAARWTTTGEPGSLLSEEAKAFIMGAAKGESWAVGQGWLTYTWRRAGKPEDLGALRARAQGLLDLLRRAPGA